MSEGTTRSTLNRERVLEAAIALADEIGIESLTIRTLAERLAVGPMTIYHYVASKEEIIDGMVESVFSEIDQPPTDVDWRTAIRQRCISANEALNRHPWAATLMESRTNPGPASLSHHDAVVGCFRSGGLSIQMAAHAYAVLESFVYGIAFEEATIPTHGEDEIGGAIEQIAAHFPASEYPHLAELTVEHVLMPGYDFGDSFEFGLDLIIDALDRAAQSE